MVQYSKRKLDKFAPIQKALYHLMLLGTKPILLQRANKAKKNKTKKCSEPNINNELHEKKWNLAPGNP